MTLVGAATLPAVDSRRMALANRSGQRIVNLVKNNVKFENFLHRKNFLNGIVTLMALGGSTNAIIHLLAIAGRTKTKISLEDFNQISENTPVLANLKPAGSKLMEDFHYAGGVSALLKNIKHLLNIETKSVSGQNLKDILDQAENFDKQVIRYPSNPVNDKGSIAIIKGSLAPDGAVIKVAAASKKFLNHVGKAIVFNNAKELSDNIDDPNLNVDENSIIVLRNQGPIGGQGMPESGFLPIPKKLLDKGIRDIIRISDARMSGTAYGTIILHVAPESYIGGPLSLVNTGDKIKLSLENKSLDLLVDNKILSERKSSLKATKHNFEYDRGYGWLYKEHILQANQGCDFDFLKAK